MTKKLTDARIRSFRPREARYEVWDGRGFGVRVALSGRKSFVFVYRFNGRPRRMTLGHYPAMNLADANQALADAKKKLDKGIDPGEIAITKKRAERNAETFKELVNIWIERWAKRNRKRWEEAKMTLEYDAIPFLGNRKVRDIKRKDIVNLLDKIMDRDAPTAANRNLQLLRQLFRYAIQRDMIEASPCTAIDYPAKEKPRDRVLSEEELRVFLETLPKTKLSRTIQLVLLFCLVTGQRRGEVVNAEKAEFEEGWWTIPGGRTKNERDHRVPLSPLAKTLLKEIMTRSGDSPFLFPGRKGGPIAANYVTAKLWDQVGSFDMPRFTTHDLRRTAASHMTGLGHSQFNVGKVLNHTEASITAVYDHYAYDKEKRAALNAWSRKLDGLSSDHKQSNVVSIN
jgi:integrase